MLPKKNRLKKKKDFEAVFLQGKLIKNQFIIIRVKKNNLNCSRFAFIVGKKITKKAVLRNRIKRRLREIIRKSLPNIKDGFDIVISVRPEILEKNYQEIKNEVEKTLKKARLLSG